MRILIVSDLFPLFEDEKNVPLTIKNFAAGFLEAGHFVEILRPNFIFNTLLRGRKVYKEGLYEDSGIRVYNKNFFFPFRKKSVIKAYHKFFKDEKFDIILCHMPSGIIAGHILSKEFKIPMLSAVHSSDIKVLSDIKYFMFKKRMLEAYKDSACVLARSFWLKNRIRNIIPNLNKPVEIIYSGVPLSVTEKNEEEVLNKGRKFDPKKAKIITVSSLIDRKNIKSLILAYKKVKKKFPKATLEIVGDGPLKEKLEILCLKKKLDVKFAGKLSKEDVNKKLLMSDIFILPSRNETFGMAYMEALSAGLIVFCTKNSGVDGIIKDGENGFLIKPSKRGIYDTLLKVLKMTNKEYQAVSKNAFLTSKMFSYENSVKNYLDKIELFR